MKRASLDYRFFDKDTKAHIYAKDLKLQCEEDGFILYTKGQIGIYTSEDLEFFSGQVDSLGKKIFEGDILELSDEQNDYYVRGIVKYCTEDKEFKIGEENLQFLLSFEEWNVEIVGYEERA